MDGFDISDIDRVVYVPVSAIGAAPHLQELIFRFADEHRLLSSQKRVRRVLAGINCRAVLALAFDRFSDWRMIFDTQAALAGFVVSLAIGTVFGGYPAMQAAAVSPIKSLNQP